jgi:hypothetical protein
MWYIVETIISINNNWKILCRKIQGFWAKGLQSLKKNKHIGSLIHDFTLFDKLIFQEGRQFKDKNVKLDIWIGQFP